LGNGNKPEFDRDQIWFNGVGKDSHETLSIKRDDSYQVDPSNKLNFGKDMWKKRKELFGFTKTAEKPYDLLVTATLILYKHHFGEVVEVSGDGGQEGFKEGLDLVNKTLKLKIDMETIRGGR